MVLSNYVGLQYTIPTMHTYRTWYYLYAGLWQVSRDIPFGRHLPFKLYPLTWI